MSRVESVASLYLDRPAHRNAMSVDLVAEMIAAIATLSHDTSIGAILVTGEGRGFCAGSDLAGLAAMDDAGRQMFEADSGRLARMIGQCPKPVVAAVHGFAVGGGLTLAAACDVIVATPESKWSLPEVPIGLFPAWGLGPVIARIGLPRSRQLSWGLETLDGTKAAEWGLVDLVTDEPVLSGMALAKRLAGLPRTQSAAVKTYFAEQCSDETADLRANAHFLTASHCEEAKASFLKFGSIT